MVEQLLMEKDESFSFKAISKCFLLSSDIKGKILKPAKLKLFRVSTLEKERIIKSCAAWGDIAQ